MLRRFLALLISLFILDLTLLPTYTLKSKAHDRSSQETLGKRQQLLDRKLAQDRRQLELDRKIANFKRTRELLVKKGVPFDPDILMTMHWRKKLAPNFAQMPELQEVKIGPRKLKGVQFAHTLYLPERVELVGDTVILAHGLVFEGRDAVIRGPFSISVYPIDQVGMLGSTVDQALRKAGVRFVNAAFRDAVFRNLPANLPLMKGGTLTIDASGWGYKEWLERQALAKARRGLFVSASFTPDEYQEGQPGEPGKDVLPGADGAPVATVGEPGAAGICGSTSSVTGNKGGTGPTGNAGLKPSDNGGNGKDGGAGGSINTSIPDPPTLDRYIFSAIGGKGGPGGRGGAGGKGSDGGRGGQGGMGANCPCSEGAAQARAVLVARAELLGLGDLVLMEVMEGTGETEVALPSPTLRPTTGARLRLLLMGGLREMVDHKD